MTEVVLVTGGAKGIGAEIVRKLAQDHQVYFTYNKSQIEADLLSEELKSLNYSVIPIKADLKEITDLENLTKNIIKAEGKIDILINNAAIVSDGSFLLMSSDKWQDVIDTNLTGTFNLSRLVAKEMIKKRKGRIINISSVVATRGGKGQANYISAKAALEGLTRAMAIELAPRGILVNAVAPGFIETEMTREILKNHEEQIKKKILLNRIGKPSEVADLVIFLAGSGAGYITGQVITVDGVMFFNQ